jgi:O-antigen biosynthesis protein WbqP
MSNQSLSPQSTSAIPQPQLAENVARQRILVTGASGFLGREIVAQLFAKGHHIISLGRGIGLEASLPNFQRIDLLAQEWPSDLFEKVDTVIHCAGLAHQFGKNSAPEQSYFDLNAQATERLFEQAAARGVRRFVLISSAAVYGNCNPTKSEDDACAPIGAYGLSKLKAENTVLEKAAQQNIHVVILRLCTLYGPQDPGNVARLVRFFKKTWAFTVGAGENRKSLMHVRDAARACVLAATTSPNSENEPRVPLGMSANILNVAGAPIEVAQLNQGICRAIGRRSPPRLSVGFLSSLGRIGSFVPFVRKLAARIVSTLEKLVRDDTIDGRRFSERYNFLPDIELADGLQEEVAEIEKSRLRFTPKRAFDIALSSCLLIAFSVPIAMLAILVRLTSKGPAIYWSNRVGKNNCIFRMAKFRSMRTEAPQVATHLLGDSSNWITPLGKLMRKTSLDELPQLWNILRGEMSFVGPRPALFNQYDLIALRTAVDVDQLVPGVTGWAQVNGRDDLLIPEKVAYDFDYMNRQSLWFDIRIIALTFWKTLARDGVRQADEESDATEKSWVIHTGKDGILAATPRALPATMLAHRQAEQHGRQLGLLCVREIEFAESLNERSKSPVLFVADEDEFPSNSDEYSLVVLSAERHRSMPQKRALHSMAKLILTQIQTGSLQ